MGVVGGVLNHIGKGFDRQIIFSQLVVGVSEGHVQNQQVGNGINGWIILPCNLRAFGYFDNFAVLILHVAFGNITLLSIFRCRGGRQCSGGVELSKYIGGRAGQRIGGHLHTGFEISQFKQAGRPQLHDLIPSGCRAQTRIGFKQLVGDGKFVFLNINGSELKTHILCHRTNPGIFDPGRPL